MSKTYFQYQGTIKSQAVAEAIAFPVGVGPFMGFSHMDLNNGTIQSDPSGTNSTSRQGIYYDKDISDHNYAHSVGYNPGDVNRYKFGLITKSGHIYVSEAQELPVTILNASSGRSELIVWALYRNIEEPIINIPTLIGYWNTGNTSFYEEFFLNTLNTSNYQVGGELPDILQTKSYKDLYDRAKASVSSAQYESNLVLIGVYGEGINPTTNATEPFSIVPYHSKYPYSQPFTPAMYYTFKGALDAISKFLGNDAINYGSLKDYITSLLPKPEEVDNTLKGVPIGTILMWNGTTIPEGWVLCDGSNGTPDLRGRFPIGETSDFPLNTTGGSKEVTLNLDNMPKHRHEIKLKNYKWGDNANNRPFIDPAGGTDSRYTEYEGKDTPSPVNIMNPWTAVKFIMRIS